MKIYLIWECSNEPHTLQGVFLNLDKAKQWIRTKAIQDTKDLDTVSEEAELDAAKHNGRVFEFITSWDNGHRYLYWMIQETETKDEEVGNCY